MSTFALIHGAGVGGGWYWHLVEAELRSLGRSNTLSDVQRDAEVAGTARPRPPGEVADDDFPFAINDPMRRAADQPPQQTEPRQPRRRTPDQARRHNP